MARATSQLTGIESTKPTPVAIRIYRPVVIPMLSTAVIKIPITVVAIIENSMSIRRVDIERPFQSIEGAGGLDRDERNVGKMH